MRQAIRLIAVAIALVWSAATPAQDLVHFPSYEDNGPDRSSTVLDGCLLRPAAEGRHPPVIFLHGCGGLFMRGAIEPGELDWPDNSPPWLLGIDGRQLWAAQPRRDVLAQWVRPAALSQSGARRPMGRCCFLQAQPFVQPDRVGVIGWSQGGCDVLIAIGTPSFARPAQLPQGDFRAAVGFYPTSCDERRKPAWWTKAVPLLVLIGAEDVGIPPRHASSCLTERQLREHSRDAGLSWRLSPFRLAQPAASRTALRTAGGDIRIEATDPAARKDALSRVPGFVARFLMN